MNCVADLLRGYCYRIIVLLCVNILFVLLKLFLKLLFVLRSTIDHIQLGCIDKNTLAGQAILYLVNDSLLYLFFFKVIIWKLMNPKLPLEVFSDYWNSCPHLQKRICQKQQPPALFSSQLVDPYGMSSRFFCASVHISIWVLRECSVSSFQHFCHSTSASGL